MLFFHEFPLEPFSPKSGNVFKKGNSQILFWKHRERKILSNHVKRFYSLAIIGFHWSKDPAVKGAVLDVSPYWIDSVSKRVNYPKTTTTYKGINTALKRALRSEEKTITYKPVTIFISRRPLAINKNNNLTIQGTLCFQFMPELVIL